MTKDVNLNERAKKMSRDSRLTPSLDHSNAISGSDHVPLQSVMDIAEREAYWYADFEKFPAVIAHEYYRLRELCITDKPYGVLLQIKDLYEILLKFEILILCAWAREEHCDVFFREVGCDITKPRLNLGDWVYIGSEAINYFRKTPEKKLPESILKPLKQILEKYQKYKVVNWRNQHVGHGAMGFGDDIHYLESIVEHLEHFKEVFTSIETWLSMQQLMLEDKPLQGHQNARNLQAGGIVKLVLTDVQTTLDLNPFICLLEDAFSDSHLYSLYSYDSQNGRLRASDMLSYPSGEKRVEKYGYFSEIDEVRRIKTQGNKHKSLSTNIRQIDEKMINQLWTDSMFYPFVEPKAVTEWLREEIAQEQSGVFFLQTERGMGKSTFCERIHGLNNLPYVIDQDTDVRVLHMERGRSSAPVYFEIAIENLWRQTYEADGTWLTQRPISSFREEGQNRLEGLLKFLKQCQEYTYSERGKDKILFVIDGLDEIAAEEIWQYIPTEPIELPKHVYLLLTSRTTDYDELPATVINHLNSVFYNSHMVVHRKAQQYVEFLYQFILQTRLKMQHHEEAYFDRIIELADYRVLHLSLICKLLESGLNLESIQTFSDIVRIYLEKLEQMYGAKEAEKLRELITIIAIFSGAQPVSLQEIADMSWEKGAVTVDLLGKISDLSPLLHIWHNGSVHRGSLLQNNLFSFANPDVRERMLNLLPWKNKYISDLRTISYEYVRQCAMEEKITDGSFAATILKLIAFDYLSEDWNGIFSQYQVEEEQLFRFISLDLPYLDQNTRPSAILILDKMSERMESQNAGWKLKAEMLIIRCNLEKDQQVYEKARETLKHADDLLHSHEAGDSKEWLLLKTKWDIAMYSLHVLAPEGRKRARQFKHQLAKDFFKLKMKQPEAYDKYQFELSLNYVHESIQNLDGRLSFYDRIHTYDDNYNMYGSLRILNSVRAAKKLPKENSYDQARYCVLVGDIALRIRRGKKSTRLNQQAALHTKKMYQCAIQTLEDGSEDSSWWHEKKYDWEQKVFELKTNQNDSDSVEANYLKEKSLKELNALILKNQEKRLAFREYMQGLRLIESIPSNDLRTIDRKSLAKYLDDCFQSRLKMIQSGIIPPDAEIQTAKIQLIQHKLKKAGLSKCAESVRKGWQKIAGASIKESMSSSMHMATWLIPGIIAIIVLNRFSYSIIGPEYGIYDKTVTWIACLLMLIYHISCKCILTFRTRKNASIHPLLVGSFCTLSEFKHIYLAFLVALLLASKSMSQLIIPIVETANRGLNELISFLPYINEMHFDASNPLFFDFCILGMAGFISTGLYYFFEMAGMNEQNELLIAKAIAIKEKGADPKKSDQASRQQP